MLSGAVEHLDQLSSLPATRYASAFVAGSGPSIGEGLPLPLGWEGLYFPFAVGFEALRADGSPARDGVLPEFGMPRRMYAGEDTTFHRSLHFGERVRQEARAGTITEKAGSAGRLVFADIIREYFVGDELAVTSVWHDVFLEAAKPATTIEQYEMGPEWSHRELTLDTRQLFQFSAITFNTHRVHYDRDWARREERLDDVLVHGPLTRMLLLDEACARYGMEGAGRIAGAADCAGETVFRFRSYRPLFVDRPITIASRTAATGIEVVALNNNGELAASGDYLVS